MGCFKITPLFGAADYRLKYMPEDLDNIKPLSHLVSQVNEMHQGMSKLQNMCVNPFL